MGNKRRLIRYIVPEIEKLAKPGEIVVDLFSGTCSVGYALKPKFVVYANDVQRYAATIAEALLKWRPPRKREFLTLPDLEEKYNENLRALTRIVAEPLGKENSFVANGITNFNWGEYKRFSDGYPYYGNHLVDGYSPEMMSNFAPETINKYRRGDFQFPYLHFSTYFANGYFGIRQAAQIDSLRYAIDEQEPKGLTRSFLLTCLISAASAAVSSTGHFAQFRNLNSATTSAQVLSERGKDILTLFKEKLLQFSSELVDSPRYREKNRVLRRDYRVLLKELADSDSRVSVIYADPPYTTAQYSRFYHVLESLILYDYPSCDFEGRYRRDRVKSGFGRYAQFREEFESLFRLASESAPNLVISYSSNGMFESVDDLEELARGYFDAVSKIAYSYSHSRQGRPSKLDVDEYLIVCKAHGDRT